MQERQVFALIVRTAGFVVLMYSFLGLFYVPAKLLGISTRSQMSIGGDLFFFVLFFVFGLAVMRNATWIVLLAFGGEERNSN